MFISFVLVFIIVLIIYIGIRVLLWRYMRDCLINDIKVAILEAHEQIESEKFYNPKND